MAFDWLSLIPLGLSLFGGLTSGGKDTTTQTQTQTLSPEMQKAIEGIFGRAGEIANKPYTKYPGQRLAPPTEARNQTADALSTVGQLVNRGIEDVDGSKARLAAMMGRPKPNVAVKSMTPQSITVPSLVRAGGPMVGYRGGM